MRSSCSLLPAFREPACQNGKSVGQIENLIGSRTAGARGIARIREVGRAPGMTLDDVAPAWEPQTTPQTIGRLEIGTRTVSVGWLNRIAKALGVDAQDLVERGATAELKVAAILGPGGAVAPRRAAIAVSPRIDAGQIAVLVGASVGDYRSG